MNGKFLHDMLVNWLYSGYYSCDGLLLWNLRILKGTCVEIPPVYKDHLKIL